MPLGPDGTGYTAILRTDGTYDVEVIRPGDLPEMVSGFITESEADNWIMEKISRQPLKDLPDINTIRP